MLIYKSHQCADVLLSVAHSIGYIIQIYQLSEIGRPYPIVTPTAIQDENENVSMKEGGYETKNIPFLHVPSLSKTKQPKEIRELSGIKANSIVEKILATRINH